MITRITGKLNRVLVEEARIQVGALEYQVLIPEFIRRVLQHKVGQEVTLHTSHYLDGNPMQGRVVPRLLGFTSEAEMEFFDLFCTVDKIGIKKALKALAQPIKTIADAIQRQDAKYLTSLPGIGGATAEKIVATLRRKVTRFALMPAPRVVVVDNGAAPGAAEELEPTATEGAVEGNVLEDCYQALMAVGHGPLEARDLLDRVLASGKSFATVEDVFEEIYRNK
jgi:Holliday junction DNA helicase RuvA